MITVGFAGKSGLSDEKAGKVSVRKGSSALQSRFVRNAGEQPIVSAGITECRIPPRQEQGEERMGRGMAK